MSSLGRATKRIRENLSKPIQPIARGRILQLAPFSERLYGEIDTDLGGRRLTVPKLGDQVISGIHKRRDRISPEELERAYRMDELVFGIINKYITVVLGTGFIIKAKDPKAREAIENWCKQVRINNILREVIRDLFVFGFSFIEKVYNRAGDKIVRLATIDTKTMDFQRDANGNIIVDNYGIPKGFEQNLWVWRQEEGAGVGPGKTDKDIPRDRIAFFRLFTTSGAVVGISPVEVLYNIITWRKNVDWGMGEAAFTYAAPPIIVNVGDKELPTPQDMIDGISEDITEIGPQSVFVFPWHVRVTRLESSRGMEELATYSDHFKVAICNALLMPAALMSVGGTAASSRAMANLAEEWERTVQGIQAMLAEQIRDQLFYSISEQLGLSEVPEIDWKTVSPSMALSRARRRMSYARGGLLTWDIEAENHIRLEEGLPLLPPDYQKPEEDTMDGKVRKMVEEIIDGRTRDEEEDEDGEKEE